MQKGGMLNSSIAKVLADLGHTDTIVIGDCGLPVPAGVQNPHRRNYSFCQCDSAQQCFLLKISVR